MHDDKGSRTKKYSKIRGWVDSDLEKFCTFVERHATIYPPSRKKSEIPSSEFLRGEGRNNFRKFLECLDFFT
jgi:hypothetical protein